MQVDRVLVLSQRASTVWKHMSADVEHGFRRLGLDVQFVEELHNGPKDTMEYWKDIVRCQLEFKPQLLFQMGHLRSNYPHGMWSGDAVHITWVQDHMAWCHGIHVANELPPEEHVRLFNASRDVIFYSFPALGDAIKKQGYEASRVHFLPPGANFDRFYPTPLPEGPFTVGFACNVGAPMTSGDPVRLERRLTPVRWLLELGVPVKLWGKGWETMPEFAPHWHGLVANGPELRRAYQSCHVTLHSNTDTGYHQRVYETLACDRISIAFMENEEECKTRSFYFEDKQSLEFLLQLCRNARPSTQEEMDAKRARDDYPARCRMILSCLA